MAHVTAVKREAQVALPNAGETYVAEDGTVSQVLDDNIDENYEPTQEEMEEFAEWIGMKLPEDASFLWVAREGLKAPLPKEWKPCRTDAGELYYFNFKTGESSWDHPLDDIFRKKFQREKERTGTCTNGTDARKGAVGLTSTQKLAASSSTPLRGVGASASSANIIIHAPPAAFSSNAASRLAPQASSIMTAVSTTAPTQRLISEAERAAEQRIQEEVNAAFAGEQQKLEEAHKARLESVRKMHKDEVERLLAADAKRRAEHTAEMAAEQTRRIQEARSRYDEQYRTELNDVECKLSELQTRLDKLNRCNVQPGSSEVAAFEMAAADDVALQMMNVEAEMEQYRSTKMQEAEELLISEKTQLAQQAEEELKKVQEVSAKACREAEVAMSTKAEGERKALVEQKRALVEALAAKQRQGSVADVSSNVSPSASSETVEAIRKRQEDMCEDIRAKAAQELEQLKATWAASLSALRQELCEKKAAASSSAYAQQLDALKARYAKEKQMALDVLQAERETQLSQVALPVSSEASSSLVSSHPSVKVLREANMKLCRDKEASCTKREAALRESLQAEWEAACSVPHEAIQQAVEEDFILFVQATEAARQANHRQGSETRPGDPLGKDVNPNEGTIRAEAIRAAVETEKEKWESKTSVLLARCESNYAMEEKALKTEVDEEVAAFEQCEMQKLEMPTDVTSEGNSLSDAVVALDKRRSTLVDLSAEVRCLEEILAQKREATAACYRNRPTATTSGPCDTPPPGGILKEVHRQRLKILEDSFQMQEDALHEQLLDLQNRTATMRHSCAPVSGGSAPCEIPHVAYTGAGGIPPVRVVDGRSVNTVRPLKTSRDYWLGEQMNLQRRREDLLVAREKWRLGLHQPTPHAHVDPYAVGGNSSQLPTDSHFAQPLQSGTPEVRNQHFGADSLSILDSFAHRLDRLTSRIERSVHGGEDASGLPERCRGTSSKNRAHSSHAGLARMGRPKEVSDTRRSCTPLRDADRSSSPPLRGGTGDMAVKWNSIIRALSGDGEEQMIGFSSHA